MKTRLWVVRDRSATELRTRRAGIRPFGILLVPDRPHLSRTAPGIWGKVFPNREGGVCNGDGISCNRKANVLVGKARVGEARVGSGLGLSLGAAQG